MATRISRRTNEKQVVRFKRKRRIRARLEGTTEKPRLSIYRSNRHVYVQLIDDVAGHSLVAASTNEEALRGKVKGTIAGAKEVGVLVARRALAKNIGAIVFDRSGYLYHGQVKAVADAAREAGLRF